MYDKTMQQRHHQNLLWSLVGLSGWITINSIFTELPLLVEKSPQGWNLPSYLAIIIQLANIGPIAYKYYRVEAPYTVSIFILLIGMCSMSLMAFTWQLTLGTGYSICLFIFTFTSGLADCTSSLTFWPLISGEESQVVTFLASGEASSSLLCSILSWIQEPGSSNPRFSPLPYFLCVAFFVLISLLALIHLKKYGTLSYNPTSLLDIQISPDDTEHPYSSLSPKCEYTKYN
eukprot:UN24605